MMGILRKRQGFHRILAALWVVFFFAVVLENQAWARVKAELQTNNIAITEKVLNRQIRVYRASKILVVFDIDHTLLTPYGDLGASYWFKWQIKLLNTPEREREQVARDNEELAQVTRQVLENIPMRTVENSTRSVLERVEQRGFPTMLLTARSPDLRKATEKELNLNHLYVSRLGIGGGEYEDWMVGKGYYTADMTIKEISRYGLGHPRPVSYQHGIFMVNKQHKGAMLRALLHRMGLGNQFKRIVVVDDSRTNCKNIQDAFKKRNDIAVTTILYTRDHPRFKNFYQSDKWNATAAFLRLKPSLH